MLNRIRFAVPAFFTLIALMQPATAERITFVLMNDIYTMSEQVGADGRARGGFARVAAVVKAERERGNHVLVTHGGDTISPSLMSGLDRGAHIIALTNLIKPDVFAPGNHEYDFGKEVFLQRMSEAKFPLFAANLRGPDGKPLPGFRDTEILTIGGVKLGIIGATFDDSPRASNPGDLQFLRTVTTVRERAEALRREGADFVVTVMHAERGDSLLLASSSAVDLFLTGHTHDLFIQFDGRNAVAESNHDGHYVVVIDVDIDIKSEGGKRMVTWWPNFRIIDTATVTPDLQVESAVLGFEREFTRAMDVPLATTAIELDSRNAAVRAHEATIGDLFADAMRAEVKAEVAITNGGGIRAGKIYPPGSAITQRDILAELPFGNKLLRLTVTGSELLGALENGFSALPQTAGRFPQISGMTVEIDPSRPVGSRVLSVTVSGVPLDPKKEYTVATNDFMGRGGDGYVQFRNAARLVPDDDAPLLANAVTAYLRGLGTVRSLAGGRIVVK